MAYPQNPAHSEEDGNLKARSFLARFVTIWTPLVEALMQFSMVKTAEASPEYPEGYGVIAAGKVLVEEDWEKFNRVSWSEA